MVEIEHAILKRGRPPRGRFGRLRTKLWAQAVRIAARHDGFTGLETVLGADGKWTDVWSRYCRGMVSPPQPRIDRIERVLPGTARYFLSPFWSLLEDREYAWSELDECLASLPEPLRQLAPGARPGFFGPPDRTDADEHAFIRDIYVALQCRDDCMHALTAALYSLREAQARRDGMDVLWAFRTLAGVDDSMRDNPVLQFLPNLILKDVVEPLRNMRFASPDIDDLWSNHRDEYCRQIGRGRASIDLIDCLVELQF